MTSCASRQHPSAKTPPLSIHINNATTHQTKAQKAQRRQQAKHELPRLPPAPRPLPARPPPAPPAFQSKQRNREAGRSAPEEAQSSRIRNRLSLWIPCVGSHDRLIVTCSPVAAKALVFWHITFTCSTAAVSSSNAQTKKVDRRMKPQWAVYNAVAYGRSLFWLAADDKQQRTAADGSGVLRSLVRLIGGWPKSGDDY